MDFCTNLIKVILQITLNYVNEIIILLIGSQHKVILKSQALTKKGTEN